MDKMVWFWNLIHFSLFRWERYASRLFNYPVRRLLRNEKVKEQYAKRGVSNPEKLVVNAVNDPEIGINSILAGGQMYILICLIGLGVLFIYTAIVGHYIKIELLHVLAILIPSFAINYFALFKGDRYLKYFQQFDRMPKADKMKYGWISFLVVLSIWLFAIGSFIFMTSSL